MDYSVTIGAFEGFQWDGDKSHGEVDGQWMVILHSWTWLIERLIWIIHFNVDVDGISWDNGILTDY